MVLHIDTKGQKTIRVSLKENGKVVKSLSKENQFGSQILLPLILKLLTSIGIKIIKNPQVSIQIHPNVGLSPNKGVHEIEVETGPGSFTGIRVGVSVANALAFSLGIPVNDKKIETDLVY